MLRWISTRRRTACLLAGKWWERLAEWLTDTGFLALGGGQTKAAAAVEMYRDEPAGGTRPGGRRLARAVRHGGG
jgi:hypothetical protein